VADLVLVRSGPRHTQCPFVAGYAEHNLLPKSPGMKLIAVVVPTLLVAILTVTAEPPTELVVQAATPAAQATPAHTPPPPIKRPSAEIVVQAAGDPSPQIATTGPATPTAINSAASGPAIPTDDQAPAKAQAIDPDSVVPKDKVIALVQRIQEQQKQIEDNQAKIDQQIYDITNVVDQAFFFSRRASK
jgi:hypothetical protein